ncbi:hypothetical protein [Streptomyces lydicus]|uniref:hypothetical protein n=1 Tax=Streptomyces lydicus TaxID=47763 RepID=UPI001010AC11|nr:hypothetical protein [Streptomyces lydicus]
MTDAAAKAAATLLERTATGPAEAQKDRTQTEQDDVLGVLLARLRRGALLDVEQPLLAEHIERLLDDRALKGDAASERADLLEETRDALDEPAGRQLDAPRPIPAAIVHPGTEQQASSTTGGDEPHPAEAERDHAYAERAALLAWLAALHPAASVMAPAADIDEPGWQLLYLHSVGGQMSWHIAPRDAALFEHVEHVQPDDPRAQWDGHTTAAKYQRIQEHVAQVAAGRGPTGR